MLWIHRLLEATTIAHHRHLRGHGRVRVRDEVGVGHHRDLSLEAHRHRIHGHHHPHVCRELSHRTERIIWHRLTDLLVPSLVQPSSQGVLWHSVCKLLTHHLVASASQTCLSWLVFGWRDEIWLLLLHALMMIPARLHAIRPTRPCWLGQFINFCL